RRRRYADRITTAGAPVGWLEPSSRGAPAVRFRVTPKRSETAMNVGRWAYGVGGTGLFILIGCAAPQVRLGDPQAEVAAMLARSAADWNAGDLVGFMSDYARDSLTCC